MKYLEIRDNIKSGDLLIWSHRGIKNWHDFKVWCIKLFTQSQYTHVGMAWIVGDRVLVLEAVVPEVRIYPLSRLGNFYYIKQDLNWNNEVESLALSYVGDKYSQLQAIESPYKTPPLDNKWECAELYATIARKMGLELGYVYTPEKIVEESIKLGKSLIYVNQD